MLFRSQIGNWHDGRTEPDKLQHFGHEAEDRRWQRSYAGRHRGNSRRAQVHATGHELRQSSRSVRKCSGRVRPVTVPERSQGDTRLTDYAYLDITRINHSNLINFSLSPSFLFNLYFVILNNNICLGFTMYKFFNVLPVQNVYFRKRLWEILENFYKTQKKKTDKSVATHTCNPSDSKIYMKSTIWSVYI